MEIHIEKNKKERAFSCVLLMGVSRLQSRVYVEGNVLHINDGQDVNKILDKTNSA